MASTGVPIAYGGDRPLPVHAELEDPRADFDSGLLLRLQAALLGLGRGQILRIRSPAPALTDQLLSFEASTGHGLLRVDDDVERAGWRSYYLRKGRARTDWLDEPEAASGTNVPRTTAAATADEVAELLPTRLWVYANYDCNLACDYCCVVASPRADPRRIEAARIVELGHEAATLGFERVFVTGGEPTLRADLPDIIDAVAARIPVTILTNAMLLRGPRWERLRQLVDRGRPVTFQVSLDSASPELHDAHRGAGAHARAAAGIATLRAAGARVRLAATLAEEHLDELPALHRLAEELDIGPTDRIFRPIALRGAALEGEPIRAADVAPEPTIDANGWSWHPISNDPDMRLPVGPEAGLEEAVIAVRERLGDLLAGRAARLDRFVCG